MGHNVYINTPLNQSFYLPVSDLHSLYIEERGNPRGIPVIYLHGGPGGCIGDASSRFFDPAYYRVILFDQRGCGRSEPFAELKDNNLLELVNDIEKIRQHFKIERWHVFGGSFGSTLALTYAIHHPQACLSLVLRGIFLGRLEDIHWLNQAGASDYFPEAFSHYRDLIPPAERDDLVAAYYKIFTGADEALKATACQRWSNWEAAVVCLENKLTALPPEAEPVTPAQIAISLLECHYFVNQMFWHLFGSEDDQYILRNAAKLEQIPTYIVHGRYDMDCRPSGAYALHKRLPKSRLWFTQAGHSSSEKETRERLTDIMDQLKLN